MPLPAGLRRDLERLGLRPLADEPLHRRGFYRIGGPADAWVEVERLDQLQAVLALGVPVTVVGNGSNLLVADAGIRGLCVRLAGALRHAELAGGDLADVEARVGAGMLNTALLARLRPLGLGGLAALAGVPGTLGGAVVMNAGWSAGEIGPRVQAVDLVLPGGEALRLPGAALDFRYRRATLPPGAVVAVVHLRLEVDPAAVAAEAEAVARQLQRRKETQPLDQPSCGSVFQNPPGDAAGRLIEAAGLKGARQGGAQVSEKHANFIVNTGGARAEDVHALVLRCRERVWAASGVALQPEVHAVGDWPAGAWPLPPLPRQGPEDRATLPLTGSHPPDPEETR